MKTNRFKYSIPLGCLCVLVACSTKRDTFLSRNFHALNTEYNILYNGQIALDKGIVGIKSNTVDDFWKRLPVERMQISDAITEESIKKNPDFELAETKATKAIQKHSMNIDGRERNMQIDEAYLLLGKSRYYDKRFVPAIDAFNYILYKYPNSSKIYEAKIWREKTNMRMGNDALVVKNITKLLKEQELKKQVVADANALLSEAFLNLEEKDSAVTKLKVAEKFTRKNAERARYRFILGQLYEELGKRDSALYHYESVIAMKRKSERKYVIHSHARRAQLFDYQNGDAENFIKTYDKLIADRENRPFLDVLNYEMGVFHDKKNNQPEALKFYNASLKKVTTNDYLAGSNYRNLGNMYFKNADYVTAAKYYDSTLVKLNPKTREYIHIQKNRKNLDEVILYEAIASRNDSILHVVSLSDPDKQVYFEKYIEKLKKEDETKRVLEEKRKATLANVERNTKTSAPTTAAQDVGNGIAAPKFAPPSMAALNQPKTEFYFYNPTTVSFGKLEFKKIWGERPLSGNWRKSGSKNNANLAAAAEANDTIQDGKVSEEKSIPEVYTTDFYVKQIPVSAPVIDSIAKERNDAYYQLGVIYKEKFKEYDLATARLEQLLQQNPEEKWILPSMYNLYKIYQITNASKAAEMKERINSQFPNSRYAEIINNTTISNIKNTPESAYAELYDAYDKEQFAKVIAESDVLIKQFSGEEIISKLELLRASAIGKLKGLQAYKKALQYVADTYSNTEEGKKAQEILTTQISFLEKQDFNTTDTHNWKIIYKLGKSEDAVATVLEEKIKKLIQTENGKSLSYSKDFYTENENFITIHGLNTEENASYISSLLKEAKINVPATVLTNENYKVIQIKKNLDSYLAFKNQ